MRNKEREITDTEEILDILRRCDTIRLGLLLGDRPYVVPVSFGMDTSRGETSIYIHGAPTGLKADCIAADQKVCVEADIFYKVEPMEKGITARYESVIGSGTISKIDGEEKSFGLRKILEHYGYADYPFERCKSLAHTAVYKITLQSITGKRNLPNGTRCPLPVTGQ